MSLHHNLAITVMRIADRFLDEGDEEGEPTPLPAPVPEGELPPLVVAALGPGWLGVADEALPE